jgi:hypothetical protein
MAAEGKIKHWCHGRQFVGLHINLAWCHRIMLGTIGM